MSAPAAAVRRLYSGKHYGGIISIIYHHLTILLTCISYESSVASGLMAAMAPSHNRRTKCTVCGFCWVARQLGAAQAFLCLEKPCH